MHNFSRFHYCLWVILFFHLPSLISVATKILYQGRWFLILSSYIFVAFHIHLFSFIVSIGVCRPAGAYEPKKCSREDGGVWFRGIRHHTCGCHGHRGCCLGLAATRFYREVASNTCGAKFPRHQLWRHHRWHGHIWSATKQSRSLCV